MVHMFTPAALISEHYFLSKPEICFDNLSFDDMLLSIAEFDLIRKDVIKIIVDIICKYVPHLNFCKSAVPSDFIQKDSQVFMHKT